MASEVIASPMGEMRTLSTAGGGTALTTSAAFIPLIPGVNWLSLTPRNFVTAVVAKYALNPFLAVIKTTDALVAIGNLTEASETVQDGLTSTSLSMNSFPAVGDGGFLYVGSHLPFRGVRVTIGNTNDTASVLTVKYRKSDSTWASISATDGTDVAGDTLKQTGNVTWTLPTDWIKRPLSSLAANGIGDTALSSPAILVTPMFWTRWEVSAALDSTVTITEMYSMNRNTANYAELLSGQSFEEAVHHGYGGIAVVEALTDAGTGNLVVNGGARNSGGGFA